MGRLVATGVFGQRLGACPDRLFHRTLGWKSPLRSSSPTIHPTPPCLLTHILLFLKNKQAGQLQRSWNLCAPSLVGHQLFSPGRSTDRSLYSLQRVARRSADSEPYHVCACVRRGLSYFCPEVSSIKSNIWTTSVPRGCSLEAAAACSCAVVLLQKTFARRLLYVAAVLPRALRGDPMHTSP